MTNRETMLCALKKYTIPYLTKKGFIGEYPNFQRENGDCIELIAFVTSKYGGSFCIEVSVVFPNRKNTNYYTFDGINEKDLIFATNKRYRLPGMFGGEFYYSDVYTTHMKVNALKAVNIYEGVLNRDKSTEYINNGYKCVQYFNQNTAEQICREINSQFDKAFLWLNKFERGKISCKSGSSKIGSLS